MSRRCTTHHEACACREEAHRNEIALLAAEIEALKTKLAECERTVLGRIADMGFPGVVRAYLGAREKGGGE